MKRAAETALEMGKHERFHELSELIGLLSNPPSSDLPSSEQEIEVSLEDLSEVEEVEELDLDADELEVVSDDEVEAESVEFEELAETHQELTETEESLEADDVSGPKFPSGAMTCTCEQLNA